jgi:hypothetical protein
MIDAQCQQTHLQPIYSPLGAKSEETRQMPELRRILRDEAHKNKRKIDPCTTSGQLETTLHHFSTVNSWLLCRFFAMMRYP